MCLRDDEISFASMKTMSFSLVFLVDVGEALSLFSYFAMVEQRAV